MLLVVGLTFYLPEVTFHGLAATRSVLLFEEGCTVGCDLREVFGAGVNRCRDGTEAQTNCDLVLREHRGAFGFLAEVEAVASQ